MLGKDMTQSRIIPANTGRITWHTRPTTRIRDHPREYGENMPVGTLDQPPEGSSPRIRGE